MAWWDCSPRRRPSSGQDYDPAELLEVTNETIAFSYEDGVGSIGFVVMAP